MRRICTLILTGCMMLGSVAAAKAEGGFFDTDKPSPFLGTPVNVGIAGGNILPKGTLLTAINASFRDKTHKVGSQPKPATGDIFSQTWLLKVRYGLFDRLEISTVVPYVNNDFDNSPYRVEGLGDIALGTSLAILSQRAGDPLWVTLIAGITLPTGNEHIPGAGVTGGRLGLSWAKKWSPNIMTSGDFMWEMPFGRGNVPYAQRDVPGGTLERGDVYTATAQARYMFNGWDAGLETVYQHSESGIRHRGSPAPGRAPLGPINTYNGVTEWVLGPSINVAIDPLKMWAGFGVFFPIYQDVHSQAATGTMMEDARFEFKLGKIW